MKKTLMLFALLLAATAQAVPLLVNYQGTYLNNAGIPVTQANVPVVISIWNDATSTNTANRKYMEDHTVQLDDGHFALKIGAGSNPVGVFNADLFNTTSGLYLQLRINGEDMLPRVRFLSAPYTLQSDNSARLGSQPATYYASAASVNNLAANINALEERLCQATYGARWIASLNVCVGGAATLSDLDFSTLDLSEVHLNGAEVTNTDFTSANLRNTHLRNLLYSPEKPPMLAGADLKGATLSDMANLAGVSLAGANLLGFYANGLDNCPDTLPEAWYCVSAVSDSNTNNPPFRLIGPGARFSDDPMLPPATWLNTDFPSQLSDINFRFNYFRNCTFSGSPTVANSNFLGARFSNCDISEANWDNTICPDGTNSDDNGDTCVGHGI